MRMIDLYVPAVEGFDIKLPFDEAYELVVEALSALGEDYQAILRKAREERWIDVYENEGKSAGAYSWGTYGTHPYVLLNYKENLDSVLTIAHEMGHSLHTYLSNKHQPYLDAEYSLFVAEVASTTNEILVLRALMERYAGDKQAQAFLTWHLLDGFRGTVFRQTMFAEFEREAHAMAERGEALTADSLNAVYASPQRRLLPAGPAGRAHRLRVDAHPPLLQRLLRLQIRHRLFGGDGACRGHPHRGRGGGGALQEIPFSRFQRAAPGGAACGRGGHGKARGRGSRAGRLRRAGGEVRGTDEVNRLSER